MRRLALTLLGPFEATLDGEPITGFESNKVRALLAYLAVEADRIHPREALAGLLWPDWPERSARANLRYALSNLRQAIGDRDAEPPFLHITRSTLQINVDSNVTCDVWHLAGGVADDAGVDALKQSVSLYRGPFLEGFSVADAEPFEAWSRVMREHLAQRLSRTFQVLTAKLEEAGDLEEARDYARRWMEEDRLSEEAHRCLMRMLTHLGDRTGALAHYETCRRVLREELDVAPSQETVALYAAIRDERLSEGLTPDDLAEAPAPGPPPYKGLQHFDVDDGALFHGREALTQVLVRELEQTPFLAVVGASGSGKSSLVRAGLVPALRDRPGFARRICLITPTARPLATLAAGLTRESGSVDETAALMDSLSRDGRTLSLYGRRLAADPSSGRGGLLLVIDQFEEVFTLCRDEAERRSMVGNLVYAASSEPGPVVIVVVLRADFYAHCGQYDGLRELLAAHQVFIGPMGTEELRQAIETPAATGDWAFEPGLVDLMLRDVGQEPGALPLLSHALLETWKRRRGRMMTLVGYQDAGAVRGAIAKTAESVYGALDAGQQVIARAVCLRLTELGEGTEDTRRRATLAEVRTIPAPQEDVETVLNKLADARLITVEREDVQVAHEALIREWPTLRGWLEEDREGLRVHRHLTESAREWERLGQEPGELYRGARLAQATEWVQGASDRLNELERAFLATSEGEARRREAEREARRRRELQAAQELAEAERLRAEEQVQATRRLSRRLGLLVGTLVVAVALGVLALLSRRQALENERVALANEQLAEARLVSVEEQRRLSLSRELAAAAFTNLKVDPERSVLLNLHALEYAHTPEAVSALHRTVREVRILHVLRHSDLRYFTPSGIKRGGLFHRGVYDVAHLSSSDQLITSYGGGGIGLWNLADGGHLASLRPTDSHYSKPWVELSSDDQHLVYAIEPGYAKLWRWQSEPEDSSLSQELSGGLRCPSTVRSAEFSPDGTRVLIGGTDGLVCIAEVASREALLSLSWVSAVGDELADGAEVTAVAYGSAGTLVTAVGIGGVARVWHVPSGAQRWVVQSHAELPVVADLSRICDSTTTSGERPCPEYLMVGGLNGTVELWQLSETTGEPYQHLRIDLGETLRDAELSPDGRLLVLGTVSGASVWDVALKRHLFGLHGHIGSVQGVAWDAEGTVLSTAGADDTARVWDVSSGRMLLTVLGGRGSATSVAFGRDCVAEDCVEVVAAGYDRGTVSVWNADAGAEEMRLSAHQGSVAGVAFAPDGRWLATAGDDWEVKLWTIGTDEPTAAMRGFAAFTAVGVSSQGRYLVTGDEYGIAQGWDVSTQTRLWQRRLAKEDVLAMQFSNGSQDVLIGTQSGDARRVPVATGDDLSHAAVDPWGNVVDIAFSSDGQHVVTARTTGLAETWDFAGDKLILRAALEGHGDQVHAVAYSRDGAQVATGGYDGSVKIWDVEASVAAGIGVETLGFQPGTSRINDLAFNGDGTRLATASQDGFVRTYVLSLDEMIRIAKERLTRGLTEAECRTYLHVEECPELP